MLKSICNSKQRVSFPVFIVTKKVVSATVLTTIALGSAYAQPIPKAQLSERSNDSQVVTTVKLTLQQAIALTFEGNLDLAVAKREIEATEGQILQGKMHPNPELAYSLEDLRTQTRTQNVQINLPIEMGGKRTARIAAAQLGRDLAVAALNVQRIEIRAAVVAAFFETLIAQERMTLAQDSVDLARMATDAAAKRVVAGKVSPVEEAKAKMAEVGVRVELAQAQSEQRRARGRLSSLLGVNPPRFTLVAGSAETLPVVPSIDSVQQRLSDSSIMRQAQLEVERRKSLVDVARSMRVSDVTFSLGMKRPNEQQRNQMLFGVLVPLPLFDNNQGNLLEAQKREDKARYELQALNVRVSTEVMQARERLEAVSGEIDVLQRDVLPGVKSVYDAAIIGFEYGKFNFLEVLDAQRAYFAAKSQYLKALTEAHRAASEIDRVLGDTASNTNKQAN